MSTALKLNVETTVKGSKGKSKAKKEVKPVSTLATLRLSLTVSMGCGIPLLCLSLSHLGGSALCEQSYLLGMAFLALCITVLSVSLSHLAGAIEDITKSAKWQSWALALAVDASLVICELMGVCGQDSPVRLAVMIAVTLFSMGLNCWAFIRHK